MWLLLAMDETKRFSYILLIPYSLLINYTTDEISINRWLSDIKLTFLQYFS